jgi:glycosyltransferase involved in cell wall biosynthesis
MLDILSSNKKDGSFTIGSLGRLYPIKDYPLMARIAEELAKRLNNFSFELAGEGPDGAVMELLIKKYNLKKIFKLRGFVNDIFAFYQGLDIYINTSLHEGIPISILEAMASGLPVIAANVGGLNEIIENGSQGYLLASRNPKDFADACLRLYKDKNLRKKMGSAAKEKIISEFSSDKMAGLYNKLYCNLTKNHGNGSQRKHIP